MCDGGRDRARGGPSQTLIRVIKPGDRDDAEWKDVYGDIEEGWITFLHQLRHRFAVAIRRARRTILTGQAACRTCPASPGTRRPSSAAPTSTASSLVVGRQARTATRRCSSRPIDLDDAAFAAAEARWDQVWEQSISAT